MREVPAVELVVSDGVDRFWKAARGRISSRRSIAIRSALIPATVDSGHTAPRVSVGRHPFFSWKAAVWLAFRVLRRWLPWLASFQIN